ncbi:hypothetical protein Hanom_Chr07g00581061 [Helianthus anomalus]
MEPSKISSETTVFFPFHCLLLLLSFSVSYRSIPFRVWIRKHGLLLFQNSNPRSQNLISNFKSLFLSFSLSLSQRFRDLDLPSRFMLFRHLPYSPSGSSLTVHAVQIPIPIWIFPFEIHVFLWWIFPFKIHVFLWWIFPFKIHVVNSFNQHHRIC